MATPRPIRRRVAVGAAEVQTFEGRVAATADDGHIRDGVFDSGGCRTGLHTTVRDMWARVDNVTVPAGATIAANTYITCTANSSAFDGADVNTLLHLIDEDDPAAPLNHAEMVTDKGLKTTASTAWDDEDFTVDVETNSPSMQSVFQEVVDRGGWASGQAMMLLWLDNTSGFEKQYVPTDYGVSAAKATLFHIEYTT